MKISVEQLPACFVFCFLFLFFNWHFKLVQWYCLKITLLNIRAIPFINHMGELQRQAFIPLGGDFWLDVCITHKGIEPKWLVSLLRCRSLPTDLVSCKGEFLPASYLSGVLSSFILKLWQASEIFKNILYFYIGNCFMVRLF